MRNGTRPGPVGRNDFSDLAVGQRGQSAEDVLQVGVGIKLMPPLEPEDGCREDFAAPALPSLLKPS